MTVTVHKLLSDDIYEANMATTFLAKGQRWTKVLMSFIDSMTGSHYDSNMLTRLD